MNIAVSIIFIISIKLFYNSGFTNHYKLSQLWKLDSKKNLIILNTTKGLITHKEALKSHVGGVLVFIIF